MADRIGADVAVQVDLARLEEQRVPAVQRPVAGS